MINIKDLSNYETTNKGYGGHSGSKKSIIIDNKDYLIKYPKLIKNIDFQGLSYITSPLSEFLGSNIYQIIGIDTHDTSLWVLNGKLVVACKDFLETTEEIIDFNAIKNNYNEEIENFLIKNSSSNENQNNDLENILYIMKHNDYFLKVPSLKTRFWDMFIIDAFISNNNRNEANWGLIYNKETKQLRLCPVFDNGASFYSKSDDNKLIGILNDDFKFKQMVYDSSISIFKENEKTINPLKYIESMKNRDCNQALIRIFPKIDLKKIKDLFDSIPTNYQDIIVFSDIQKQVYYKSLEYKYNIFKNIYDKLKGGLWKNI